MRVTRQELEIASDAGILDPASVDRLWQFLIAHQRESGQPTFNLTHLLWYMGALIVISAMGLFSNAAFNRWGGAALAATAAVYAALFLSAGHYFWHRQQIKVLGGLLVAVAVSMAPLATYGIQEHFELWTHDDPGKYRDFFVWVRGSWLFMSLSAVIAGLVALRFYPFPFITMIVACAVWFISMDLAPWFMGEPPARGAPWTLVGAYWNELLELRGLLSFVFGIPLLAVAWFIDVRFERRFVFWLHLAAALCFQGGAYIWLTHSVATWTIRGAFSLLLLLLAVFLQRRVYAVFGGLGMAGYLGYLSHHVFEDEILFSFSLTGIGILVMALGYGYFRYERELQTAIMKYLPAGLARLRPV